MKILVAQLDYTVGNLKGNSGKIMKGLRLAREKNADIVLFSELCLCGYPPEDLLAQDHFIEAISGMLDFIAANSSGLIVIAGTPRVNIESSEKKLFNSAVIIQNGLILGYQDKSLLPTYDVFDERRYFEPAYLNNIWMLGGIKVGVTICEDIWQHSELLSETVYRRDPVEELISQKPDLVLNLSASPYSFSKLEKRMAVCSKAALTLGCPLIFCNQVGGNDSLIFDGHSLVAGGSGEILLMAKGFEEDYLLVDLSHLPKAAAWALPDPISDLYHALVLGVKDYFTKLGFKKACLGLSGGIDSALVACIAVEALGAQNVLGVMMPSRFSSEGSIHDAEVLAKNLQMQTRQIPIEAPFQSYLDLLKPEFEGKPEDVTEENLQARIRGMILMALSNKLGYLVLSTGNKSELAMGYSTLYGDLCGGLAVISDVTKQQVYALAEWINRGKEMIPWNTLRKAPSAELRLNQTDQDTLPAYSIVDNVLKAYVEDLRSPEKIAEQFNYPLETVRDLVKRIHRNEYKRRQSPPGLRVSEKAFSVGRRFPIVERWV